MAISINKQTNTVYFLNLIGLSKTLPKCHRKPKGNLIKAPWASDVEILVGMKSEL